MIAELLVKLSGLTVGFDAPNVTCGLLFEQVAVATFILEQGLVVHVGRTALRTITGQRGRRGSHWGGLATFSKVFIKAQIGINSITVKSGTRTSQWWYVTKNLSLTSDNHLNHTKDMRRNANAGRR